MNFRKLQYVFIFFALWLLMFLYLNFTKFDAFSRNRKDLFLDEIDEIKSRIKEDNLRLLQYMNKLTVLSENNPVVNGDQNDENLVYSEQYLLRRSQRYANEIRLSLHQLINLKNELTKSSTSKINLNNLDNLINHFEELLVHLDVYLDGLGRVNNKSRVRIKKFKHLADWFHKKLDNLQNPPNCKKAKFLLVEMNQPGGFGCNFHHLQTCFILAIRTGRTLLFNGLGAYDRWWRDNFKDISLKCKIRDINHLPVGEFLLDSQDQVVSCPFIAKNNSEFLPPAVPTFLADRLQVLHGHPFVWYVGQIASRFFRPKQKFLGYLNKTWQHVISSPLSSPSSSKFANDDLKDNHQSPIVGIHIRRTDKLIKEASFHALDEYMVEVERYFEFLDVKRRMMMRTKEWTDDSHSNLHSPKNVKFVSVPRRVFIITDEPRIFEEVKTNYKNYTVYGIPAHSKGAEVSRRLNSDSIRDIVSDIIFLSKTDYIVCTFSSNVCRLAYALMQTRYEKLGDASNLFRSLDHIYYFVGRDDNPQEVIVDDPKSGLKSGDLVHYLGNHWNGFAKVRLIGSHSDLLVPAFKIAPKLITFNMTF